jgi:hypothetical protein
MKYLQRTKDMFLVYGGDEELVAKGYIDASFTTDPDDFKTQLGSMFTSVGGAVSWKSYKQDILVNSITEVEYIAAADTTKGALE